MQKKSLALALALALVMLLGALSACGNTEPEEIGGALGDVGGVTAPPAPISAAALRQRPLPSLRARARLTRSPAPRRTTAAARAVARR